MYSHKARCGQSSFCVAEIKLWCTGSPRATHQCCMSSRQCPVALPASPSVVPCRQRPSGIASALLSPESATERKPIINTTSCHYCPLESKIEAEFQRVVFNGKRNQKNHMSIRRVDVAICSKPKPNSNSKLNNSKHQKLKSRRPLSRKIYFAVYRNSGSPEATPKKADRDRMSQGQPIHKALRQKSKTMRRGVYLEAKPKAKLLLGQ